MKKYLLSFLLFAFCLLVYCNSNAQTPSPRGYPNRPPVAHNDTASVTQPDSVSVNVRANDTDPDGNTLCITNIYGSHRFALANCDSITYHSDTSFVGMDTCMYRICDDGTPVLCDTAMLVVTVYRENFAPIAHNDTASVTQSDTITINVAANDTDPYGDTLCVTSIYGSTQFNLASCTNINFHPDSNFVGKDTCWYVICDNGAPVLCDTAMLVVTVNSCLPVVSFTHACPVQAEGNNGCWFNVNLYATYRNADSTYWHINSLSDNYMVTDTIFENRDTLLIGPYNADLYLPIISRPYSVCLIAYNNCGSNSYCDTIYVLFEGINEIQLSGINIYPNPASNILTIDMRNNNDEITSNYASIEIYNALGQKVKTLSRKDSTKVLNIPVTGLAEGAYLAAIIDSKGVKRTLGRFVKE